KYRSYTHYLKKAEVARNTPAWWLTYRQYQKQEDPEHDSPAQVHYGNRLTPTEAAMAPQVSFVSEEGSLWTLLLTSPDEHLLDSEGEYVHWLVGNIPGGAVTSGEELCQYLAPIPAKATGFHRFVYILASLSQRSFKTVDFYRNHQDRMTPAGLSFFQSQWD
ncbi:unnamed protein product, partial [Coregonus sp. 'balchen']